MRKSIKYISKKGLSKSKGYCRHIKTNCHQRYIRSRSVGSIDVPHLRLSWVSWPSRRAFILMKVVSPHQHLDHQSFFDGTSSTTRSSIFFWFDQHQKHDHQFFFFLFFFVMVHHQRRKHQHHDHQFFSFLMIYHYQQHDHHFFLF